jgi:hypothetical protein
MARMLTPMGWPPDEENGNFQEYNFDRGGRGGDAVQANAQDGSGYNVSISAARDLDESSG